MIKKSIRVSITEKLLLGLAGRPIVFFHFRHSLHLSMLDASANTGQPLIAAIHRP